MMSGKGIIALMGSGELTATMVEVHKELLGRVPAAPRAVFLDTPAGFQLNVDQLSQKAVAYFRDRIQQPLTVASFKAKETMAPHETEQAFRTLQEANYVLIGPGSPTYAVRNWQQTLIPELLIRTIERGGCLIAASAAALTVGRFCLPVYEIYKVGEALHWVDGVNLLAHFGFNLAVVPHWNNAEGGTHDTRFCYMGEARFERLQALLPEDVAVFGLDEHTTCLLDLDAEEAVVKGLGRATLRWRGSELSFGKGERFPLGLLRGDKPENAWGAVSRPAVPDQVRADLPQDSFWERIHELEARFHASLEQRDRSTLTSTVLDLDRTIWQAHQDRESAEFVSQAREVLREMIVLLGMKLESPRQDETAALGPLVEAMIALRERFRQGRQWAEADAVRDCLERAHIVVEDTRHGPRWHLESCRDCGTPL